VSLFSGGWPYIRNDSEDRFIYCQLVDGQIICIPPGKDAAFAGPVPNLVDPLEALALMEGARP
jgi:hypothetical protein